MEPPLILCFILLVFVARKAASDRQTYMEGSCQPGQYYNQAAHKCQPCPEGQFMSDIDHQSTECNKCSRLTGQHIQGYHLEIDQKCTPTSDATFKCKPGYYSTADDDIHSVGFRCRSCEDHPDPHYAKMTLPECGASTTTTTTTITPTTTISPSPTSNSKGGGHNQSSENNRTSPRPHNVTHYTEGVDPGWRIATIVLIILISIGTISFGVYCIRKKVTQRRLKSYNVENSLPMENLQGIIPILRNTLKAK